MEGLHWAFELLVIYCERNNAQILVVVTGRYQVNYHWDVNECVELEVCEKAAKTPTPS